jgi:hypothetical protein
VDRRGERHVGPGEPCFTLLDPEAAILPELPEDLLDVEGVALAFAPEEVEQRPPMAPTNTSPVFIPIRIRNLMPWA